MTNDDKFFTQITNSADSLTRVTGEKFWLIEDFHHLLVDNNIGSRVADLVTFAVAAAVLVALIWVIDKVIIKVSLQAIRRAAAQTQTKVDDLLVKHRFFARLLSMLPLLAVLMSVGTLFEGFAEGFVTCVVVITKSILYIAGARVIFSLMSTWQDVYEMRSKTARRPVRSSVQAGKIVVGLLATILVVATLLRQDPSSLFIGLGTAAALLTLVFKDTILGFVASIQISAQDMVRVGDWIVMPTKDADGNVTEINVNSVKVKNWDNTVTMIPIYSIVSESFTNYRHMEQSAGRRFVRTFFVNLESVKFVDDDALAKVDPRVVALAEATSPRPRLTNLALFRAHIYDFIAKHPDVNTDLAMFVRYTHDITDKGVGVEIYAFSRLKAADGYDSVHRSVVEFVVASAPKFGIVLFQSPSGEDFSRFITKCTDHS